jgi:hypothetical protein
LTCPCGNSSTWHAHVAKPQCRLQSFTKAPEVAHEALTSRHTIAATLQLWVVSGHPISPIHHLLRAGAADPRENLPEGDDNAADDCLQSWLQPSGLLTAVALLGDLCPPPWPRARSTSDKKPIEVLPAARSAALVFVCTFCSCNQGMAATCEPASTAVTFIAASVLQAVHFRLLKNALALGMTPFAAELATLVRTCRESACRVTQAALVRFLMRALGCGGGMAYALMPPLSDSLEEVYASLTRGSRAAAVGGVPPALLRKLHSVTLVLVPLLKQPMGKTKLLEQGLAGLLGRLLHQVLGAWNRIQDEDEAAGGDHRVLCRLLTEGIRALCNPQVRGFHLAHLLLPHLYVGRVLFTESIYGQHAAAEHACV